MVRDIYLNAYKETSTIKSTVRERQGNLKRETERQKGRQRITKKIY